MLWLVRMYYLSRVISQQNLEWEKLVKSLNVNANVRLPLGQFNGVPAREF